MSKFTTNRITIYFAVLIMMMVIQGLGVGIAYGEESTIENIGKVSRSGVRHVNAVDAQKILEINPDVVVLDVRTPVEFKRGRLENSINVNYYSFSFKKQIGELDKDKIYLLHCQSGVRSGRSIPIMLSAGFKNIIHMDGGISEWKDQGLPLAEK